MYMNLKPYKHKIISFNTTTVTSFGLIIVGTPPPSLLLGCRTFQKLSHLGQGGTKFFARKGNKPVKGGGGGVDTFLLLYSSIIFTVCEGKVRFLLLLFGSSVF